MRPDPNQLSFFEDVAMPEKINGIRVVYNDLHSWKPAKYYKILAHDRQEWPAETLIVQAVSEKQAKFFYNEEVGHQYKYNWDVQEIQI